MEYRDFIYTSSSKEEIHFRNMDCNGKARKWVEEGTEQ